jgi:NAD dependent epimerase/dehydratase family enzyme
MVGEMADEALLPSVRVMPARLTTAGFTFRYPELKPALEFLLLNHTAA